jgi:ubiquilin
VAQPSSTPSEPPEQRFASQITQLEEMGFSERDRNIRALLATGGDVQAAIEYLLTQ